MTQARERHVAVVGAGPAGLYAAAELLRDPDMHVDLIDRLATPGGLARYGVAPDHEARRRVAQRLLAQLRGSGRFRFFGEMRLGADLAIGALQSAYDAVLLACGCPHDRSLGIPGESLPGSHGAAEFVGWYNGHPAHAQRSFDLSAERAIVIGHGNVALDLARMLLLEPQRLSHTDIAPAAIDALRTSRVREVVLVGRRGPAQASFTTPEMLELLQMEDLDIVVEGIDAQSAVGQAHASLSRVDAAAYAQAMKASLVHKMSDRPPRPGARVRLRLRFLAAPLEVLGDTRARGLRVAHTRLGAGPNGSSTAERTGEESTIEGALVLRAIGFLGEPIPGIPFDETRSIVPNTAGRVVDPATGLLRPRLYVTGWLRRGPSGVIGSNRRCAEEVATAILGDLAAPSPPPAVSPPRLPELLASQAWLANASNGRTNSQSIASERR